jgi:mannonate dehydratase
MRGAHREVNPASENVDVDVGGPRPYDARMDRRAFLSAVPVALSSPRARAAPAAAAAPAGRATAAFKVGCQQGPLTEQRLRFLARHGVRNICGTVEGRSQKGAYTVEELRRLRAQAAAQGISLDMMRLHFLRPSSVDDNTRPAIVLGDSPQRDRDIEEVQTTIRNCAAAGVPGLTYNLSLIGYQRNRTTSGRGGAQYTAWRLADVGPGGERGKLTRAGRVPADVYWERITYFLERVVPVAAEHKVRLSCHPQDPPTPPGFRGIDGVLGTVEGLKRFVGIAESPYHGLNFCQGTVAQMLANPAQDIFEVIRWFGSRKKIFNVHFRNIRGRRDDFEERFPDEGDIDMRRALQVYREVGYDGMLMPDHVPKHPEDPGQLQAFAFCYGYIRALIQSVGV